MEDKDGVAVGRGEIGIKADLVGPLGSIEVELLTSNEADEFTVVLEVR